MPNFIVFDKCPRLTENTKPPLKSCCRWYKNGKEFYSYLPGKASPVTVHELPGVTVEAAQSSMNYVTLSPLGLASTGRWPHVT